MEYSKDLIPSTFSKHKGLFFGLCFTYCVSRNTIVILPISSPFPSPCSHIRMKLITFYFNLNPKMYKYNNLKGGNKPTSKIIKAH